MAIWNGKMLNGVLGLYVFREMNGKQVVSRRLAKGEMKQTEETKRVAAVFGMAGKLGNQLRGTVKNSIDKLYDPAMSRRLTMTLKEILIRCCDPKSEQYSFEEQSFSRLNGFDYNLTSPLNKNLIKDLAPTMANGILSIVLSASKPMDLLIFPEGSSACELTIGISLFRLKDGMKKFNAEIQVLTIRKYGADIDRQNFEFAVPDGCLCVVSVFLKYYTVLRDLATIINSKTFSPAGICTALITPGLYKNTDKRAWVRMPNLEFKVKR